MSGSHDSVTRGIVIGRTSSGEGSVRVALYTEARGLTEAFAKSAREERSKLRAHLQLGTCGVYSLVRGKHEWRLTGAVDTTNAYFALADKPYAQLSQARLFGMLRALVHGEEENVALFSALWAFLEALPHLNEHEVRIAEYLAAFRILTALGYVAPSADIPHVAEDGYSKDVLESVAPFERTLITTINEALLVSNLT